MKSEQIASLFWLSFIEMAWPQQHSKRASHSMAFLERLAWICCLTLGEASSVSVSIQALMLVHQSV